MADIVHRRFLKSFLPNQTVLRGYLLAATRDPVEADDLFQEVSSVLWEKFGTYDESRPFRPWALGVARLEVVKWRQRLGRSREVISEETLLLMAETAENAAEEVEKRGLHLGDCLEWLKGLAREVVRLRYAEMLSISQISERLGKSAAAIGMVLVRSRRVLQDCLERKLAPGQENG
jgi:RNA polymerase sigma-70 factor (ECF subfamily)